MEMNKTQYVHTKNKYDDFFPTVFRELSNQSTGSYLQSNYRIRIRKSLSEYICYDNLGEATANFISVQIH